MNVRDLILFAQDANTSARVTIMPFDKPGEQRTLHGGLTVRWEWDFKGFIATYRMVMTDEMLSEDRWPHFSIRNYLQMASTAMVKDGGTPNRKSPLFVSATEVLDYRRQKELLDMKLASGIIGPQNYADALAVLLCRRNADNALWFGANRNG